MDGKTGKALLAVIAGALLSLPAQAQEQERDQSELIRYRELSIRLQREVDSLQTLLSGRRSPTGAAGVVSSLQGGGRPSSIFSTWDLLLDDEPENAVVPVTVEEVHKAASPFPEILDIGEGELVRRYISYYTVNKRKRMETVAARYERYSEQFRATFRKYGVPEDLCLLSIVESAVNPYAVSKAGAVGMWQLMESTGKTYGLTMTASRDDRYDVEKATDVAARYLSRAYQILGDWRLAVSSYNCGIGRVQSAIRKAGTTEFWGVWKELPQETQAYMPSLIGVWWYMHENDGKKN